MARRARSLGSGTASDFVFHRLSEAILRGTVKPGQRLRQDALAQQYRVSIIPVREALRRLESNGLVTIVAHRGAIVADLSEKDIAEVFGVRIILETAAVRLGVPNLQNRDIAQLRRLMRQISAPGAGDQTWLDYNREFRMTVYRASGNERLVSLIRDLFNATRHYRALVMLLHHHRETVIERHQRTIEACARRDVDLVERLLRESLESIVAGVAEMMQRRRDQRAAELAAQITTEESA